MLETVEMYRDAGVELAHIRAASGAAFPLHTHAEYVLSVNLSGCERIRVDGRTQCAAAGDTTLYNPQAPQSSAFEADTGFVSLYLAPDTLVDIGRACDALSRPQAPELTQGVVAAPLLRRELLALWHATRTQGDVQTALTGLVMCLLRPQTASTVPSPDPAAAWLDRVTGLMRATLAAPPGLDALAAAAGMDRFQLIRRFKATLGLTPARYHMQLRLEDARRRLRAGEAVAEVALALGFYDQSHFINTFRKHMAIGPLPFARAAQAAAPTIRVR